MLRWGLIIVLLGLAAAGAGWLAQRPGMVAMEWGNYRVDTSVPVLLILIGVLAVSCAVLYRLWWSLRRMPQSVSRARHDRQQRRGYAALSRGLVAVAAGDSAAARKQARRAYRLNPKSEWVVQTLYELQKRKGN